MAISADPDPFELVDMNLARDDLVELETAFDKLGRHKFGDGWPSGMGERARLGRRGDNSPHVNEMIRWALSALEQCVENGWLPLVYFDGERPVRRISYPGSDGFALRALYPKPTSDSGGQIELDDGSIHTCIVNVSGFDAILKTKFGLPSARRGPKRKFLDFDKALDQFFQTHPITSSNKAIIASLSSSFTGDWPAPTTRHKRIDEARDRYRQGMRSE